MEMFVIMTWEYRIIKFIYKDRQTIIIIPKIYKYQKNKNKWIKNVRLRGEEPIYD
jgi:hypothetical protein